VDLSGVIFVVLAVAWAVYLIPKALQHHDEVARTRSIDRFSTAMRVLARREPVDKRHSRLVVTPKARAARSQAAAATTAPVEATREDAAAPVTPAGSRGRLPVRRAAARAAARRRRRILTVLLLCDVAFAVAAYLGRLAWWDVAVPAVLTVAYLVLCRTQVRSERVRTAAPGLLPQPVAPEEGPERTQPPGQQQPLQVTEQIVVIEEQRVDEHGVAALEDEDTVGISVEAIREALLPTADGGTLWDPLPVTLPTYVGKPRAQRTVRTIDLGEPGTWTSGRTAQDAEIAAQARKKDDGSTGSGEGGQRAVGS
jgi:hypothetical protein